jgi:hypothetical protein
MKKVKALLAVTALVMLVTVASVAQAATVSIAGTVGSTSASLGNCGITGLTLTTAKSTSTCSPDLAGNTLNGFTISYESTGGDNFLNNTTGAADTIDSLTETAGTDDTCPSDNSSGGDDCFAFAADTTHAGAFEELDDGGGALNVDPESPIPTTPAVLLYTGSSGNIATGTTFDMTYSFITRPDQASGDYTYAGTTSIVTL